MAISFAAASAAQQAQGLWLPSDHGLLTWTVEPQIAQAQTAIPTAGRMEFTKIKLGSPAPVTSIVMYANAAGNTLTAGQCLAALYTAPGTAPALIAQTADQAAAWASTGLKTMALAGGPYSLAAGNYYIAFWFNGTTGPAWTRTQNINPAFANMGLATPALRIGFADTGLTTTAPASMGAQTGQQIPWWAALS